MINHYHFDSVKKNKKNHAVGKLYQESVGSQVYKLQLNVDFNVNDLKLLRNGNKLLITGNYESNFHIPIITKKRMKFRTEIELPEFVDKNRISSFIVSNHSCNVLTIEAPVIPQSSSRISIERPQSANLIQASNRNSVIGEGANDLNNSVLRYEYNLAQYGPEDIDICVENGNKLIITAVSRNYDNYGTFI